MAKSQAQKLSEMFENMDPAAKIAFANDITHDYTAGWLSGDKRKLAIEIFRLLCLDAETQVKRILAERLQKDDSIPKDIAAKLARDVAEISLPILKHSPLLDENELVTIVNQTTEMVKLEAIAERDFLPEKISLAIIDRNYLPAAEIIAHNNGAEISENVILQAATHFKESGDLLLRLMSRHGNNSRIADKVMGIVSAAVRQEMLKRQSISPFKLQREMLASREWATLALLTPGNMQQAMDMTASLDTEHRLTNTVIIRSLYVGAIEFFAAAMSRRADVGYDNTVELLSDKGGRGFRALYLAARMPANLTDEVYTAYNCAVSETESAQKQNREFSGKNMLEAVTRQGNNMEVDNMHFLLGMVEHGKLKPDAVQ